MLTRALFERLGFERDSSLLTDEPPGYRYDFGGFVLTAAQLMSKYFQPVFVISGIYHTNRVLADIWVEMPLEVDTFEQGVAWIAYSLVDVQLEKCPDWLAQGRSWQGHLPWVRRIG